MSAESDLSIKGKAYLAGIYEHPTRHAPDKSTAQLHAEVAKGALEDAGLTEADIDGYFCAGDAAGGVMAMADYMGLKVRHSIPRIRAAAPIRSISRPPTTPPRTTFTACAPCATCMSLAPPASNWPGSRSRHPTTRNTTSMRCCATSSPSRTC